MGRGKKKSQWLKGGINYLRSRDWVFWLYPLDQNAGNRQLPLKIWVLLSSDLWYWRLCYIVTSLEDLVFYVFIYRFPAWLGWRQQYEKESTKSWHCEDIISVLSEDILPKTWKLLEKRSWHRKCYLGFIYNLKTTLESVASLYSSSTQTTRSCQSVTLSNAEVSSFTNEL